MNELALFAGAGGGLLGSRLLGHTPVCAVELDEYARRVLLARQQDGHLPKFPIWDDICTFDGKPWRGRIDIVSGGFPCQPFSSAARGRNVTPDLWPEMLRVVLAVRSRFVFAENVKREPIERAAADLAGIGYRCRAAQVSGSSVGAPHIRKRWWLLGDSNSHGESMGAEHGEVGRMSIPCRGVWPAPDRGGLRARNGLAHRLDRMRTIGNGQIPAVAALAWHVLGGPRAV